MKQKPLWQALAARRDARGCLLSGSFVGIGTDILH